MNSNNYVPKAKFGWVDFSPDDRERFNEVMSLLSEPGTVDELGIGPIRNAFSDALFPGITTIMTRAKYFMIVPNIIKDYLLYDFNKVSSIKKYLHNRENELMEEFTRQARNSQNELIDTGIIGYNIAKRRIEKNSDQELVRKPSAIYWNGLKEYRIVHTGDSLSNFLKYLDSLKPDLYSVQNQEELSEEHPYSRLLSIPSTGKNWEEDISILLTETEADFLENKIIDTTKGSLLEALLEDKGLLKTFVDSNNLESFVRVANLEDMPQRLKANLIGAVNFWEVMKGAHILYNILFFDMYNEDERVNELRNDKWEPWLEDMQKFTWSTISPEFIWKVCDEESHNVKDHTMQFIAEWFAESKKRAPNITKLEELVKQQEKHNKGSRNKLSSKKDPDKFRSDDKDWIGFDSLGYRFNNAKQILIDINNGLNGINA